MKHKHHIIPKHIGGTDDPSNIIELSVEEHAQAHKELYEKYGRIEDKLAWKGLSGMLPKIDIIEEIQLLAASKGGIAVAKNGGGFKGRKHSEETKAKQRQHMIGNTIWLGKKHTTETKAKMSAADRSKEKNSQFGTKWITDGKKNSKLRQDNEMPVGWKFGRIMKTPQLI